MAQRYSLGSFGRGRSFIGDLKAVADEDGNVSIEVAGTQRLFILQEDGSYLPAVDEDYGTLILEGEAYRLEEQSGVVTVFRPNGSLNFIEDPNGNRITAEYANDRITGLVGSDEDRLTFTYNDAGRIASVADRSGRITTYEYDETGELLLRVASPEGSSTFTYDDNFAITSVAEGDGTQANLKYDDFGRLIEESLNEGAETITYSYNNAGNVTVTDASGATVEFFLDDRGQVNRLQAPLGQNLNLEYDELGNLIQVTAPDNNALNFTYDDRGNLLSQVDSLGQRTEFTYEPNFQLLESVTDPRGNAIDYDYDDEGNLISINYADGNSETYSYDEEGNFTQSVNRRGQTIAFNYNQLGQLLRQDNADGSFYAYTYDEQGNLTSATDDNGTISLEYDTGDRLTKIIYPDGRSLTYTYDAGNSRTSMVDRDGNTVNYSYDLAGRLAGLTDGNGNSIVDYTYDNVGRLVREDNGNGTYTTYAYDDAGQLSSLVNYAPDDSINSRYDYSYNELGQQIGASTLDGDWTYSYDAIGQLTGAVFASTNSEIPDQNLEYVYDAAGNRIRTIVNGDTTEYSANNLNQYETAGDIVYDYDADGNLISKTEGDDVTTYEYDNENRLVKVIEPNGNETEYEYDPIGNRIATIYNGERTEYLIDPFGFGDIVGEYDGDGNLIANYTHGNGLVSRSNDSESAFYDADAIGSTVGLTNAAGNQVNNYSYLPFGQELSETEAIENSFEFVGQWGVTEETNGLDFMRARLYDPLIGRFMSPDPIGISGGDPNLYRYVFNNPNNYADPSGTIIFAPIIAGILIGAGTDIAIQAISNSLDGNASTNTFDIDWGSVGVSAGLGALGGGWIGNLKNVRRAGKVFSHTIPDRFTRPLTRSGKGPNPSYKRWIPKSITDPEHPLGRLNGQFVSEKFHWKTDFYATLKGQKRLAFRGQDYLEDTGLLFVVRTPAWLVSSLGGGILGNIFGDEIYDTIANASTDIFNIDSQTPAPGESPAFPIVVAGLIPLAALNVARSKGEPHLTTFDGVGYDFQGAGDFTLVESLDGDFNVQVRYVQIDDNVTVASAVATEVDGQSVVIDSEGIEFVDAEGNPVEEGGIPQVTRLVSGFGEEATVTIGGEAANIPSGASIEVGNSRIYRSSGERYTIVYAGEDGVVNDGDDQLVVDYLRPGTINTVDVYLGDEKQGQITGLLGNLDGNPDNDVALRDGTVLPRPLEFDRLYGDYRDDYRVTNIEESLFTYEPGQNPDTYYNPNFPEEPYTYADLSPALKAIGDAAALDAGYEPETYAFESAAFDFAVTRDPGFLEGSATDPTADGVAIIDAGDGGIGTGTASIQGIKFNDLNGNGVRDTELVQGENPDVLFVIDVSLSAEDRFQGTSVGDVNGDDIADSILDAEIAGFIGLNQQLIDLGLGNNANVGVIAFSLLGTQSDLDSQTSGVQAATTPNADSDGNGIPDVEDALRSLQARPFTNFEDALQTAEEFFISLGTEPGEGNLVFLSDGENQVGGDINDEVERLNNLGVNLSAFGAGENASLEDLQIIDPDAEIFTSTDELLDVFAGLGTTGGDDSPSLLEPGLEGVSIYLDLNDNSILDDGEPSQVTDENGQYLFTDLAAGTYTVREVVPNGSSQTAPMNGEFTIELGEGEVIEDLNFGNLDDRTRANCNSGCVLAIIPHPRLDSPDIASFWAFDYGNLTDFIFNR
ncbi:MAG: VWD domain-containing protein [Hydrococcus sp. C42_A2020_068]|nr:VWD domain-containing protein [Hydrococcus sp. C42_A2020_068]